MNDHPASGQDRNVTAKREFIAFWQSSRDADGLQPAALEVCPYPGLRSFRPNEADLFYGRDLQIKELRDLLAEAQHHCCARRFRFGKVVAGPRRFGP